LNVYAVLYRDSHTVLAAILGKRGQWQRTDCSNQPAFCPFADLAVRLWD